MRRIILLILLFIISCGEEIDIEATIDARAQKISEYNISKLNTPTPQPVPTAQPTATPQPAPTVTPFQEERVKEIAEIYAEAAAEVSRKGDRFIVEELLPEVVPQLAPMPTPQPTATPQPTPTPQPLESIKLSGDLAYDIYRKNKNKVVMIEVGNSTGTGWIIEDGWIISNEHVVGSSRYVLVFIPDPNSSSGFTSIQGEVFGIDKKRDLAAIRVDHGMDHFKIKSVDVNDIGKEVFTIGYSAGNAGVPSSHSGIISYVKKASTTLSFEKGSSYYLGDELDQNVSIIVFDAAADPGDSGGPIIDSEGNAIGIVYGFLESTSGKRTTGQQMGTNIASIEDVWDDLKNGKNTTYR